MKQSDLVSEWKPTMMFSMTLMLEKSCGLWNVLARPNLQILWEGRRETSLPSSRICPEVRGKMPLIRLKSVVFRNRSGR